MNSIYGKIVLEGSGVGIPDLLVVLYDLDPKTRPEEVLPALAATSTSPNAVLAGFGDRIGSTLTGADGAFSVEFEDNEFRIRNEGERRPDILLLVFAPQAPGKSLADLVLFVSPEIRQNAGRREAYAIHLGVDALKKAGLPIPGTTIGAADPAGDGDLAELEGKLRAGRQFFERKAALLQQHVEAQHTQHVERRTNEFSVNVREELSTVPKSVRESSKFVGDGQSVRIKNFDSIRDRIAEAFNAPPPDKRATASGFIYLTQDQLTRYAPFVSGDEFVLPDAIVESEILPSLFRRDEQGRSANDFLMDHPAVRTCVRAVNDELGCEAPGHGGNGSNGAGDTPDEGDDTGPPDAELAHVKGYIARQMQHVTPPEGIIQFGVTSKTRPTAGEVGEHVVNLELQKGPADRTAFYDFHTLHIAFDHVWKEAADLGILGQAEALYDEVVGTGQAPTNMKGMLVAAASKLRFLKSDPEEAKSVPPVQVIFEFPEAVELWGKMVGAERQALTKIADAMLGKYEHTSDSATTTWGNFVSGKSSSLPFISREHLITNQGFEVIAAFRQKGQRILDCVRERVEQSAELKSDLDRYKKADVLAAELEKRLKDRYSFTYFAADGVERSINFGVLVTYRQQWEPLGYQAGELVRTIPLAPKEFRRYQKRTLVKKSRTRKEIEDNLRITKSDSADTNRAESEIIAKALNKSSFTLGSTTTFEVPVGGIKIGNTITTNSAVEAQRDSSQTKKNFREAVIKASQEYKNERRVEISMESSEETENTESGEISNPNDALTVTYLFYELQRQFRVNECLHRMRPVVLVAQEMPAPHEIDDDWIVRHDWMLKRALLDDSFLHAFECVTSIRGEKLLLGELERTVLEQRKIVNDLRQNVRYYTDETGRMSRLMQAAINKEAAIAEDRDFWDGIPLLGGRLNAAESALKGVGNLLGMGQGDDPKEAARIRREGIKDAYERADRERRELMGRLEQETNVLNGLTKQVAEKRKDINEKEVLIARLKNHLKDHILHYMQAIWSYEHPDQRFFRLFNTKVPLLHAPASGYNMRIKTAPAPSAPLDAVANLGVAPSARKERHAYQFSPIVDVQEATLAEVADLEDFLGFKGNYMIFPLLKSNVITDFMMAPYVDSEFELLDPDALGNWTLEEFQQLYCCLRERLGDGFGEIEPQLKEFYRQLLLDPLRPGELITVPTGSLFIEALPGEHEVLEDFKLLHRAVDVKRAQADVRRVELENIRYAARILAGEREDPDVERKIVVDGSGVIVNPEP